MAALAVSLASVPAAVADGGGAAPPAPCASPAHRALDFWIGSWDVTWEGGGGTNVVASRLGGCMIEEAFRGDASVGGLAGFSASSYDADAGLWCQTWIDDQGGSFDFVGGPEGARFVLSSVRPARDGRSLRMVFEDIAPDSFTWRWQARAEGEAGWTDLWVIAYARAAPATQSADPPA